MTSLDNLLQGHGFGPADVVQDMVLWSRTELGGAAAACLRDEGGLQIAKQLDGEDAPLLVVNISQYDEATVRALLAAWWPLDKEGEK